MRSVRGFVGAATVVLSYPAALAVQLLFGAGGNTVIHLVMGAGFVIFATSVADFGLPRWVNVLGAAAAGLFGVIFLLQGVSDLTHLEPLEHVAFDILGQELERFLPDVVYLWFVVLLLVGSTGKSRVLGWVVMLIVVGLELAALATHLLGRPMASVAVLVLLPFVWLLFESAEPGVPATTPRRGPAVATPVAGDGPGAASPTRRRR